MVSVTARPASVLRHCGRSRELTETVFSTAAFDIIEVVVPTGGAAATVDSFERSRTLSNWRDEKIIVVPWPKPVQLDDGRWHRRWNVVLVEGSERRDAEAVFRDAMATFENNVALSVEGRRVEVDVYTRRWPLEDDLFFYNFRVLKCVEDVLGEIELIEGEPRNKWRPWRVRG